MPPQHDIPDPSGVPPRTAEVFRLREEIDGLIAAARRDCRSNPALDAEVRPLIRRLEEIRRELDRQPERAWRSIGGELYPFLIQRALAQEPYTP